MRHDWRQNQDSPPNGSPVCLYVDGAMVGAVYLLHCNWWAVSYGPRRGLAKVGGKRDAMRAVERDRRSR